MMNDPFKLLMEPAGETLLRNLSISPKKWSNLILELSELCQSGGSKEAISHVIEHAALFLYSKQTSSKLNKEPFNENDIKRLHCVLNKLSSIQNVGKISKVNTRIFSIMQSRLIDIERDESLIQAMQSISFLNTLKGSRKKSTQKSRYAEIENFAEELGSLIEYACEANNLHTYLILLKLLLTMWEKDQSDGVEDYTSLDSLSDFRSRFTEMLETTSILDLKDLTTLNDKERYIEHMASFESTPRLLLVGGQPSKMTTFEVQGKAVGIVSGISVKYSPAPKPVYFEVTLKGRGFAGIRIGWAVCGANVARYSSSVLGSTAECWVFEGFSEHFFHDSMELSRQRRRQRAEEEDTAPPANDVEGKGAEENPNEIGIFSDLFSDDAVALEPPSEVPSSASVATDDSPHQAQEREGNDASNTTTLNAFFSRLAEPSERSGNGSGSNNQGETGFFHGMSSFLDLMQEEDHSDLGAIRRLLAARGLTESRHSVSSPQQSSAKDREGNTSVDETESASTKVVPAEVSTLNKQALSSQKSATVEKIYSEKDSKNRVAYRSGGTQLVSPGSQEKVSFNWNSGTILGCLLNPSTGVIEFSIDGVSIGLAPVNIPLNILENQGVCPVFSCNSSAGLEFNVGQSPFRYKDMVSHRYMENLSSVPRTLRSSSEDESVGKAQIDIDQKMYELISHRRNSFISVTPTEGVSSSSNDGGSAGSGIILNGSSSDSYKSMTFEASFRLRPVDSSEKKVQYNMLCISPTGTSPFPSNSTSPGHSNGDEYGCNIGVESDGTIYFEILGSGETLRSSPRDVKFGEWSHIAVIYTYHRSASKANATLLLNGEILCQHEIVGSKRSKIGKLCPRHICVGGAFNSSSTIMTHRCWYGDICEVRIWGTARSSERIQSSLGRSKISGVELDLLCLVAFEEGEGSIVHDIAVVKNTVRSQDSVRMVGKCDWCFFPPVEMSDAFRNYLNMKCLEVSDGYARPFLGILDSCLRQKLEGASELNDRIIDTKDAEIEDIGSQLDSARSIDSYTIECLMAAIVKKLLVSCERYVSDVEDEAFNINIFQTFRNSIPQFKSILEPCALSFMMINSILRQIIYIFNGSPSLNNKSGINVNSEHNVDTRTSLFLGTLAISLLDVLKCNVTLLAQDYNVDRFNEGGGYSSTGSASGSGNSSGITIFSMLPERLRSEICSNLIISMLYFISGCRISAPGSDDSMMKQLRAAAANLFSAGVDVFIPKGSNLLFAIECLGLDDKGRNNAGDFFVQHEITAISSNANPALFFEAKLPSDPLLALLSLSPDGKHVLHESLCSALAEPHRISSILPEHLLPVSDVHQSSNAGNCIINGLDSTMAKLVAPSNFSAIADKNITPKLGDLVRRGPHWCYGDQDGVENSIGIVIDIGPWQNKANALLKVNWCKSGSVNSYRYAAEGLSSVAENSNGDDDEGDEGLIFDVSIYRSNASIARMKAAVAHKDNAQKGDHGSSRNSSCDDLTRYNAGTGLNETHDVEVVSEAYTRRDLAYTAEEVRHALVDGRSTSTGGGSLTKRSVLLYVKENSPVDWQDKMRINRPSNSLLSRMNAVEVSQIYQEFYRTFSASASQSSKEGYRIQRIEPRSRSAAHFSSDDDRISRLLNMLVGKINDSWHSSTDDDCSISGIQRLLNVLQAFLVGAFSPTTTTNVTGGESEDVIDAVIPSERVIRNNFSVADKSYSWDWSRGVWREVSATSSISDSTISSDQVTIPDKLARMLADPYSSPSERQALMSQSEARGGRRNVVNVLTDLEIDKSFPCGNIFVKNRIRSLEIVLAGDRGWNTCICTTALRPNSGIYTWYVKIKNFAERRGFCMLGVATKGFTHDEFLGQDSESWGLSPNMDTFHNGRKRRAGTDVKLSSGSVLEFKMNTYDSTLTCTELCGERISRPAEPVTLEGIKSTVYPAFSLFSPGDCLSVFGNSEDIDGLKARNLLLTGERQNDLSRVKYSKKASVRPRSLLLGSPNHTIISYTLQLLNAACRTLQHLDERFVSNIYKHPLISIYLPQCLASLSKWTHVPASRSDILVTALNELIVHLNSAVVTLRGHIAAEKSSDSTNIEENTDDNKDNSFANLIEIADGRSPSQEILLSTETLIQLASLSSTYLGIVLRSWINGCIALVDNAELLVAVPSVSDERSVGMKELPIVAKSEKILLGTGGSPTKWLTSALFSNGYKGEVDLANDFLYGAFHGEKDFNILVRWLSLHDKTHPNYRRFGGEAMLRPVHLLFVVNVYHAGYVFPCTYLQKLLAESVKDAIACGSSINDDFFKQFKPPAFVLHCWEIAMKLRIWSKEEAIGGLSYEFIAQKALDRCLFLLELEQSTIDKPFDRSERNLSKWLQNSANHDDLFFSGVVDKHITKVLSSIKSFVTENTSIAQLRVATAVVQRRAASRRDGLKWFRAAIGNLSPVFGCGAKCGLVVSLPEALKGSEFVTQLSPSVQQPSLGKQSTIGGSTQSTSKSHIVPTLHPGHYLRNLDGIKSSLRLELQGTFDSFYACLTEELSMCNCDEEYAYQLCLFDCLGLRILEQDHTMLSRINFFYTLQEILDSSFALMSDSFVSTSKISVISTPAKQTSSENSEYGKLAVKAAMKLFILMSLQVATSRDDSGSSSVRIVSESSSLLQAPMLRKIKSGPATLSKSVFDILFTQLQEVSQSIYSAVSASSRADYFTQVLYVSPSANLVISEATTLLLCVSNNPFCQKILLRPKWLTLLIRMAVLNSSVCQQKALLLLCDILCSRDSSDAMLESFEDVEFPDIDWISSCETCSVSQRIVQIFLALVGNMLIKLGSIPLVANAGSDFLTELTEVSLPVISEAVALIRSLYISTSWRESVQAVLQMTIDTASKCSNYITNKALTRDLLATFCVLGGQIDAPYRNCPVIFQSSSLSSPGNSGGIVGGGSALVGGASGKDMHLGVFVDFHQSVDKVVISYIGRENASRGTEQESGAHLSLISTLDKIQAVNRCPAEKLVLNSSLVGGLVELLDKLILSQKRATRNLDSAVNGNADAKDGGFAVETKEEEKSDNPLDCSLTEDVDSLICITCARAIASLIKNVDNLNCLTNDIFTSSDCGDKLLNMLLLAQERNRSGGLSDLPVYEEYFMIVMRQRQRLWATSKQAKYTEEKTKRERAEEEQTKKNLLVSVDTEEQKLDIDSFPPPPSEDPDTGDFETNASEVGTERSVIESNAGESKASEGSLSPHTLISPSNNQGSTSRGNQSSSTNVVDLPGQNLPPPAPDGWISPPAPGNDPGDEQYDFPSHPTGVSMDVDIVESLSSMGFPKRWCQLALNLCGGDPEEALNYILSNGMQLEEMLMSIEGEERDTQSALRRFDRQSTGSGRGFISRPSGSQSVRATTGSSNSREARGDELSSVRIGHYDGRFDKVLAFYAEPNFAAERLGCIYPGDDLSIVDSTVDSADPTNIWYKLPYSDFDDGNYQSSYGDEIFDIFVWVPKNYKGEEVIKEGAFEGDSESPLANPPGDSICIDKNYRIIGTNGALVREGIEISSREVTSLKTGEYVHACEETFNSDGTLRLRLDRPVNGWISKLFGLVEKIGDYGDIKKSTECSQNIDGNKASKQLTEVEEVQRLDDHMELSSASDAFSRDERFFGNMQGNMYCKHTDKAKSLSQSLFNRRMRVSGMSTYHNYLQGVTDNSLSKIDSVVSKLLNTLELLYCRKIFLALLLRSSRSDLYSTSWLRVMIETVAQSKSENDSKLVGQDEVITSSRAANVDANTFGSQLCKFIRLIAFRGEPYSYTGMEFVSLDEISAVAAQTENYSIEQVLDGIIVKVLTIQNTSHSSNDGIVLMQENYGSFIQFFANILIESVARNIRQAAAPKYADHVWADSSYEEDLDDDIIDQPNLHYAAWITRILLTTGEFSYMISLMKCWTAGLRVTSLSMKLMVYQLLREVLLSIRSILDSTALRDQAPCSSQKHEELTAVLDLIPTQRLVKMASRRLWAEMEDAPSYSRYLQALIHLLSEINSCNAMVGRPLACTPDVLIDFQLKTISITDKNIETNVTEDRPVVHFDSTRSHVQLSPHKEQSGPWTVEFWILRRKNIDAQNDCVITLGIADKAVGDDQFVEAENRQSEDSRGSSSNERWSRRSRDDILAGNAEKKIGLTGLLNLLLGSNKLSSTDATSQSGQSNEKEAEPQNADTKRKISFPAIPPNYLLSSNKCSIKLQAGGRLFSQEHNAPNATILTVDASPLPSAKKVDIPDVVLTSIHSHKLHRNRDDNGWACDGRLASGGCRKGCSDFRQTKGWKRWRCSSCDFDLCEECVRAHTAGSAGSDSSLSLPGAVAAAAAQALNRKSPRDDLEDPQSLSVLSDDNQDPDPVCDEAFCVALCPGGSSSTEKCFDYVVPYDRWVHLAIVCQTSPINLITLYADGEPQDSLSMSMNLPMGMIGSNLSHSSFSGDLAEMRAWSVARSRLEIQRDMNSDVTGAKNLISHLKFNEGSNKLVHDHCGLFSSCKMHHCSWQVLPTPILESPIGSQFMINDVEESANLIEDSVPLISTINELTGIFKMNAICGAVGEMATGFSEVVCLTYRKKYQRNDSSYEIEGYLNWCDRDVRSALQGVITEAGHITFAIGKVIPSPDSSIKSSVVVGAPENLDWLHDLKFEGQVNGSDISGQFTAFISADCEPPVEPGCSRIDPFSKAPEMKYSKTGSRNNQVEHLSIRKVPEGQYLAFVDIAPYRRSVRERINRSAEAGSSETASDSNHFLAETQIGEVQEIAHAIAEEKSKDECTTDEIKVKKFGLCAQDGCYWLEWVINSDSGNLAFGVCTSNALTHPDASVDANDGTWTYNTSGQASHGANLLLCDCAEDKDRVSIHIDTNTGTIDFYKNYQFLVGFDDLLNHPMLDYSSATNEELPGIRPFVSLAANDDSVTYHGAKFGPINLDFPESDPRGRRRFLCQLAMGTFNGFGWTSFHNSEEQWFGTYVHGRASGLHIRVDSEPVMAAKRFSDGEVIHEYTLEEIAESSELASLLLEFHEFESNRLKPSGSSNDNSTSDNSRSSLSARLLSFANGSNNLDGSSGGLAPSPAGSSSSQQNAKITIVLHDSSGDNSCFKVHRSIMARRLFEAYALKRDTPMNSFIFKSGDTVLQPDRTIESQGIDNNAILEVSVRSVPRSGRGSSYFNDLEDFIKSSSAQYILQVVYDGGAYVRTGIEIESNQVRTLSYGEVVESFQHAQSSESVGRFRVADGWISEKLRGGSEAMVVRIVREKLSTSEFYRVIRSEGARIRSEASLSSLDVGFCPEGTVVTIDEVRYIVSGINAVPSSNESCDVTKRVHIISPAEWRGWASVKDHILEKVSEDAAHDSAAVKPYIDPSLAIERERRKRVKGQRKAKYEMNKSKIASKYRKDVHASGSIDVSEETFFLLRKRSRNPSAAGNAVVSRDFTTVTCDSNAVSSSGRSISGAGRSMVFGSRGFARGVHYWEVHVDSASWGSVFIGVAAEDSSNWNGYGLLNYRATQAYGCETLYGSYFSVNDKVGVLLNMDNGTISFFKDGEDFNIGKVTVINMGVAYHNLRRSSSRVSKPVLFPCFGVKMNGDQLSIRRCHWISSRGMSPSSLLHQILCAKRVISNWHDTYSAHSIKARDSFTEDSFNAYKIWSTTDEVVIMTRPGLKLTVQTSDAAIEAAAGEFAKSYKLKAGKIVRTQYGEGRIVGARKRQLWYTYEGGEHLCWYWRYDEIQDLLDLGAIKFDVEASAAALTAAKYRDVLKSDNDGGKLSLTETDFHNSVMNIPWRLDDDARIAHIVSVLTDKYDVDPYRIPVHLMKDSIANLDQWPFSDDISFADALRLIYARYNVLAVVNKAADFALPFSDFNCGDNRIPTVQTRIREFDLCRNSPSTTRQCSGDTILRIKKALFTQTKLAVWNLAIRESITPTAAPPDEYERPDDLREISINRVEARNAERLKDSMPLTDRLRISVFGQLFTNMNSWDDRSLRRSYTHMQDAGQSRAFFVKFTGEGVDDQGGPYRAVFQTAVGEEIINLLDLLVPCPNAQADVGEMRDRYIFNPQLMLNGHLFQHLGKLIAMACRHSIMVPLSFPSLIWKPMAGEDLDVSDLKATDATVVSSLQAIVRGDIMPTDSVIDLLVQALTSSSIIHISRTNRITSNSIRKMLLKMFSSSSLEEMDENERAQKLQPIINLIYQLHLTSQKEAIHHMMKGMASVLPTELLTIFTAAELESIFCGEAEVDISVLKKATIYEAVSPNEAHIQYFWNAVEELDNEERSQLVNFCSGRSRLPAAASDFPMSFKLTAPPPNSEKNPDDFLPIARTCFFSLSLPKYTSQEICLEKLKYAIRNTELMDADFIDRRGTSGWENVR